MATYADPNGNGTAAAWSGTSTNVDDAVRQPSAPDGAVVSSSTDEQSETLVFTDPTYVSGATYTLWIYSSSGAKRGLDVAYSVDGSDPGTAHASRAELHGASAGAAWRSRVLTIASQTELDNLRVQLICNSTAGGGGAGSVSVDAVYVEIDTPAVRRTEQYAYRGYDDDAALGAATPKAAQNTGWTQDVDLNFRVRFGVEEDGGLPFSDFLVLTRQLNGGGFARVDGTSTVVRAAASANVADDANIPAADYVLTGHSATGDLADGKFDEADGAVGPLSLTDQRTEIEFCVQVRSADVGDGDTIELRLAAGAGVLDSYLATATIVANVPTGVTGDSAQTLPSLTQDAAGVLQVDGTADGTLPNLTADAAGALQASGTAASALPTLTQDTSGTVGGGAVVTGAAAQTLPSFTQDAAGDLVLAGDGASPLPALLSASAGALGVSGAAANTLPSLAQDGAGAALVEGAATQTLPSLTQDASAVLGNVVSGSISQDLPALGQAAEGGASTTGQADSVLPGFTQAAAATSTVTGDSAGTLGDLATAAGGALTVAGEGSQTLPALVTSSEGAIPAAGAANSVLPGLVTAMEARLGVQMAQMTLTAAQAHGLTLAAQANGLTLAANTAHELQLEAEIS